MSRPRVGLFATCLVDLFRPRIGFAAATLLERAGCEVVVPEGQTCCGQPAWNNGDARSARALALATMDAFADCEAVVAPSGSCIGMLRQFPEVLGATDVRHGEAIAFAERCHELSDYLVTVRRWTPDALPAGEVVTYHDSCAGLRECGIKAQPRALLAAAGVEIEEMTAAEVCCGFGGTFCVKYPEISSAMADAKLASARERDARIVAGGDLGCLLALEGRDSRRGDDSAGTDETLRFRHYAELLVAGDDGAPS